MERAVGITGRDLAAERVRAGLLQREVADRLGVSRRRIAQLEASRCPTATTVRRYLVAVMVRPDPGGAS